MTDDGGVAPRAYELLREAIVEGRFAPGERLKETGLAEDFGLSRTPIREAIRRLEAEGLVVTQRNKGAVVRRTSRDEVADLYGLRMRLESYAAELAAERATETDLQTIGQTAEAFGQAVANWTPDDLECLRDLHGSNRQFHDGILAASRHQSLAVLLARTVDLPLVFRALRLYRDTELERSDAFHRLILDAIRRRDGARAGAMMSEHIAQGRDAVLGYLS